ncbi:MAG TPA: hypothetical protein VFI31_19700 [Pirellulales bacterium]|nr:hypothetical protein [Pirellulales bacterium]
MSQLSEIVVRLWTWFTKALEIAIDYCTRRTNPRHAVGLYLAVNVVTTAFAAWLTKSWADFFSVAGYWVTLTGFILAIIELYRTRMHADLIRLAVANEAAKQRGIHYRFCLERARSALIRARDSVHGKQWAAATGGLDELIEYLSHINSISPAVDESWQAHMESSLGWTATFTGGKNGKSLTYNVNEWNGLVLSVLQQINDELAPFQHGQGISNDPE